jgi:hypothetical protein
MRLSPRRVFPALAVLAAAALAIGVWIGADRSQPLPPPPNHIVPDQFVSRLTTEALGDAPNEDGWRDATTFFQSHGCTVDSLREWARDVYLGDDYAALGYDDVERAITLYAGALAREPDPVGLRGVTGALAKGDDWDEVVARLLRSPEFTDQLAPAICDPGSPAYDAIGPAAPIDVPVRGAGFQGDQATLQAQLNATPPGGRVSLAQHAVVRISSPLRVPAGVTLTTAGDPPTSHYARMGRLVRAGVPPDGNDATVVDLQAGAVLRSVWVTGGRSWVGAPVPGGINVRIQGTGAVVESSKLTDPLGGGNLWMAGPHYGVPCATARATGNLITGYTTEHVRGKWADGISVACAGADVTGNTVVDATDVGIVVYRADGTDQASKVADNTVVAAGRSAFAALAADPLFGAGGKEFSFRGTRFADNLLWTGARSNFAIGLAAGTRAWFGSIADQGAGASFTGNTTGDLGIRTNNVFAVSGMLDVTLTGNHLRAEPMEPTPCPPGPVAAIREGLASGAIQGPTLDRPLSGCIGQGF